MSTYPSKHCSRYVNIREIKSVVAQVCGKVQSFLKATGRTDRSSCYTCRRLLFDNRVQRNISVLWRWFVGLCAFREPLKIFLYSGQLAGELTELIQGVPHQ